MTLQDRLEFCSICTNRKMNFKVGLICSLTEQKPDFEDHCVNFIKDDLEAERKLALKMDSAGNVETSNGTKPRRNKILGILIFILGFGVSITSFFIGFGKFVIVAYGAIIYGISLFVKGILQERVLKKDEEFNNKIEQKEKSKEI